MTAPFSDELISAYLDGELTAQEQECVEAQLRENADLRRLCDELRTLRATLQAMPVAEPPESFAERIMRQAERRMLSGEREANDDPGTTAPAAPVAGAPRRQRTWRVSLGVAAALAASVLAMLWLPQYVARHIAQAPTGSESQAVPDTAMSEESLGLSTVSEPVPQGALAEPHLYTEDMRRYGPLSESHNSGRLLVQEQPASAASSQTRNFGRVPDDRPHLSRAKQPVAAGGLVGEGGGMGGMPGAAPPPGSYPYSMESGGARGLGAARRAKDASPPADTDPSDSATQLPGMGMGMGAMTPGMPGAAGMPSGFGMPGGPDSETRAGADIRAGETVDGEPVREETASPATPSSVPVPGVRARGGSSAAADAGRGENTEAENGLADSAAQPAEQLIGELISQLDQDQVLLVKVRAPQAELFGAFDALQTADPGNTLAFDESATGGGSTTRDGSATRALDEGVRPHVMQQTDVAKPVESAIAVPTQTERERVENLSQQVLVLKGSADQIRQVLTDLAARPGVAIEPARSELDAVRQRWTKQAARLEQQAEADAAQEPVPADRSLAQGEKATQPDKAAEPDKSPQPARPADDALARDTRDTELARHSAEAASVKWRELARQAGMFYIYFRLHPDTTPPKPAAPPDDH